MFYIIILNKLFISYKNAKKNYDSSRSKSRFYYIFDIVLFFKRQAASEKGESADKEGPTAQPVEGWGCAKGA